MARDHEYVQTVQDRWLVSPSLLRIRLVQAVAVLAQYGCADTVRLIAVLVDAIHVADHPEAVLRDEVAYCCVEHRAAWQRFHCYPASFHG